MATTVGYSFPDNSWPVYSWPTYHWPGLYGFNYAEIYDASVIMNIEVAEFVMLVTEISASIIMNFETAGNVMLNTSVEADVVLNKEISQPDYEELHKL